MTAVIPARGVRPDRELDGGPAPDRRPEHRRGQHLRPVVRPRPRRSPAVPALVAVGIVISALLGLAVMHALLIGGQVRLDAMRGGVASETEAIRRLELRVAELESPDRVLDAARDRLGMVQPTEVGYLLPASVAGVPAEPVRVVAATVPEPEPGSEPGSDVEADPDVTAVDGTAPEVTADAGTAPDDGLATGAASEGGRDE